MSIEPASRVIGEEARKSHEARRESGFIERYLSGAHILDIGYRGYVAEVVPIVPQAIGVELDYPGYDGLTLPFPDGSQDAVFASHCLEHIPDFANALRDWFRVLRVGGFIVVMVPHQYLYEKRVSMPSQWNADHKRFYTPAALMTDVESTLTPNTYRLRHLVDNDTGFDYTLDPARHSGGSYEIELVIEKIEQPGWLLEGYAPPPSGEPSPDVVPPEPVVPLRRASAQRVSIVQSNGRDLAIYDFSDGLQPRRSILVLKLDHFGDFIIGVPAMQELRAAFPDAHIRIVCGSWNVAAANGTKLFDEVRCFDFFPENALGWDGKPSEALERFREATAGSWNIAIDLRVDDDTRFLLEDVDADMRCGIGTRTRMGFLDIALPPEHEDRRSPLSERMPDILLRPGEFHSVMPVRSAFFHSTGFAETNRHLVYGPYVPLPLGRLRANFGLQMDGTLLGISRVSVTLDIARDQSEIVALRDMRASDLAGSEIRQISLEFDNRIADAKYEFRVYTHGRPWRGQLRFFGVQVEHLEPSPAPRLKRAELHIGEQLSLLVKLIVERNSRIYETDSAPGEQPFSLPPSLPAASSATRTIVIAPVGNSDLRNWPLHSYVELVRLLLRRLDCRIVLTGSRTQTGALTMIAQQSGGSGRILNLAGRTSWTELPAVLDLADLVICNNSGVAHLAAARGVRTLAIYSASHQPQEWGPRGARARAVMAMVSCSPCGHDRLSECPNGHACMVGITAEAIADIAVESLATADERLSPGVAAPAVAQAGCTNSLTESPLNAG